VKNTKIDLTECACNSNGVKKKKILKIIAGVTVVK